MLVMYRFIEYLIALVNHIIEYHTNFDGFTPNIYDRFTDSTLY